MISFTNSSKEYKMKCSFVLWKSICYILRGNLGFTNCMKNWKRRNMEKTKRRKTISHICIPACLSHTAKVLFLKSCTVRPQPIWIKVRTWWQIPQQHQSTYSACQIIVQQILLFFGEKAPTQPYSDLHVY